MDSYQDAIHELFFNPKFESVLVECLETEEFVLNFERLFCVKRPTKRRCLIEIMVDDATGFNQSQWNKFLREFIPFVYRYVWLAMPDSFRSFNAPIKE